MANTKTNIVTIIADDMGFWALGCAGNKDVRTPNLDRLAASGLRFDNFFCVSPVCSPARSSILTGRIPSAHGVHDWIRQGNSAQYENDGKEIEYLKDIPGYTEYLAEYGYTCAISGKWHMGSQDKIQKGYSFWRVCRGHYYNQPMTDGVKYYNEPRYMSEAIVENGLEFLKQEKNSDAPFCLDIRFTAPHSPWTRENHPSKLWDDYRQNCAFTSTPNLPIHPWQISSAPAGYNGDSRKDNLSGYYTAITAMDEQIGRLLDFLEQTNQRENTIVLFTSDNGMNMGHHGLWGKGNASYPQNMYDQSVKVPMIISQPGTIPEGKLHSSILSHYDIFPTLLEWTNTTAPDDYLRPGKSFASILKGSERKIRDNIVIFDEYGPTRMIRTDKWKYVHRSGDLPCELYDLENDADEKLDLMGNNPGAENTVNNTTSAMTDAVKKKQEQLKKQLNQWFACYSTEQRDGFNLPVTGKGQLDLCWNKPATNNFNQEIGFFYDKDRWKDEL